MTFTYNLSASGEDLRISKVRLEVGDTIENDGIRPDGSNLADAEVSYFLDKEDDDIGRAAAAVCESMANTWARYANTRVGPRREDLSDVAESWAKRAEALRDQYGGGDVTYSVGVIPADGYGDAVESTDIDGTGSEYG